MRIHRNPTSATSASRKGFTLIELLVVISIIATLMALILPAIQQARANARNAECLNNLHNIAVGLESYVTAHNGKVPQLYKLALNGATPPVLAPVANTSWMREIIEEVGRPDLEKAFRNVASLPDAQIASVKVLQCPVDSNNFEAQGGSSYVANGGYTFAGTPVSSQLVYASGVFFPGYATNKDHLTKGDGLGQTIFITENNTNVNSYFFDGTNADEIRTRVHSTVTGTISTLNLAALQLNTTAVFAAQGLNGTAAWAAKSGHQGTVNVLMGDGATKTLSDDMDTQIYFRLLTSSGYAANGTGQALVPNDEF